MGDLADMLRRAVAGIATPDPNIIFSEEPVSLTVFVQDKAFLGNPPLSPVQYDAVRHVERVYYPTLYPAMAAEFEGNRQAGTLCVGPVSAWREEGYWGEDIPLINFATLQWGKGGGKDHVCRVMSMRIAYLLMCLRSPQAYFGLPEQDTIHLLNVASSSAQAQQAFFLPITRAVRKGWFSHRCEPRQNLISFEKYIEAISGHSDAETQEGLNLMLGIADEIDAFRTKREIQPRRQGSGREPTKSAEGILKMLRTSAATRFGQTYKNVRISYPRYLGSTIQRLTAEAREDIKARGRESRHYVSGPLATWQVNPRISGPEVFADDYAEDPVMARAMYECRPSRAINPYFRNKLALDACFVDTPRLPVVINYELEQSRDGASNVWVPQYYFAENFVPIRGAIYAMHADMAITADRAGIAMAHVIKWSDHEVVGEDEDGAPHTLLERRPHIKVDFVVSFTADASVNPPREIQIRWARQLCFELIRRGFNVRRLTFDGFQSVDSMQILQSRGLEAEKVSTDTDESAWRTLRDLMYEGRITIPKLYIEEGDQPVFLLREELLSLSRQPNGKIDHPPEGSKDAADALACAVLGALACGGEEEGDDARAHYSEAEFDVGTIFEAPYGTPNISKVWEGALPGALVAGTGRPVR